MEKVPAATHYDAVIVGSGHNGLVAAAYLAGAGQSVLVLEKNETLGGATASAKVFPDYDALLSRYSYLVSLFPSRIIEAVSGFVRRPSRFGFVECGCEPFPGIDARTDGQRCGLDRLSKASGSGIGDGGCGMAVPSAAIAFARGFSKESYD
jgi:hypothetical protein